MNVSTLFLITMSLMDCLKNDGTNAVDEYKARPYTNLFLNILTMEINMLAEISQIELKEDSITSMNDSLYFDKYTCTNILPYRIASTLYELNGDANMSILMANKAEVALASKKQNPTYIKNIFE